MKLFDRVKSLLGGGGEKQAVEEIVRAEGEVGVPATRAYLRAIRRSERLRGPGYTRPMRKGRTQRTNPKGDE